MKYLCVLGSFALLLLSSCTQLDKDLLTNQWTGVKIMLDDDVMIPDASVVRLDIRPDETFTYVDMNGEAQNGTWQSRWVMLYLYPAGGFEKAWHVTNLTQDSMTLKIEQGSKDFKLFLAAGEGE